MSYDRRSDDGGGMRSPSSAVGSSATSAPSPGKSTLTQPPLQRQTARDISMADPALAPSFGSAGPAAARKPAKSPAATDGPAPRPGPGAATLVGAVEDPELAFDNRFTPMLMTEFQDNPQLGLDDILQRIAARPYAAREGDPMHKLHPTIAQYGQPPSATEGNKKRAVLIGNQHYRSGSPLYTPIDESLQMQSELASRGYDAHAHSDQTAAEMGSLWSTMVGQAQQGDDLVAYFSGHGMREGLVGINGTRDDLYANSQVTGVVSAATGRGAHLRFIIDACHAGAQVQAAREVRENELATVADSVGGKLHVTVMVALREARDRLLEHIGLEKTTGDAVRQAQASGTTRDLVGVDHIEQAFDHAAQALWDSYTPVLDMVRAMVGFAGAPPPVSDHLLAPQLKYLDDLWNAVSRSADRPRPGEKGAPATP